MKKLFVLSILSLVILAGAFAQVTHDPDDSLIINAKIASVFDVVATSTYGTTANALVLDEQGKAKEAAAQVGLVTINTNSRYWKITVSEATNGGNLKAVDGSDVYTIPFAFLLKGGATAEENWLANAEVLDTGIDWNGVAKSTESAFTKRTTPRSTDSLNAYIYYDGAASNGANWVSKTTGGADLVYTASVMITASVM